MSLHRNLFAASILCLAALNQAFADEKIVVITSRDATVSTLTLVEIKELFLGEIRYTTKSKPIVIVDRDRNSSIFKDFYAYVAEMSPKEVSVHWAKKIFTGQAHPPTRIVGDDEAAKSWVRSNSESISYIYAKNLDSTVKVIDLTDSE